MPSVNPGCGRFAAAICCDTGDILLDIVHHSMWMISDKKAFHTVVWRRFSSVVDKCTTSGDKFLQDSTHQKLLKSVYFSLAYLKSNRVTFLDHSVHTLYL